MFEPSLPSAKDDATTSRVVKVDTPHWNFRLPEQDRPEGCIYYLVDRPGGRCCSILIDRTPCRTGLLAGEACR